MNLKGVLYGLGIIGALVTGWVYLHHANVRTDKNTTSQTLPAQDKAKVIVNERSHTITTVVRVGQTGQTKVSTAFLAPNASIETKPDGSVVVTSRVWGTEHAPYIGTAFDSEFKIRTALGVNVFYWQRWEVGGGLSLSVTNVKDARVYVGGSYNVYGNILLTGAVDNHKAIGIGVALKF